MRTKMRWSVPARRRLSVAVAITVLAFGGIVLSRAQGEDRNGPSDAMRLAAPMNAEGAREVRIQTDSLQGVVALTQGAVLADGQREVFGEIRVEATQGGGVAVRRPVALAVVLDTSGSMSGEKIASARDAVRTLLERMHNEDQIALIGYDHTARILMPMLPLTDARRQADQVIGRIEAGGGTNIPAGLELGAQLIARAPASMARRLVLVSDGLDGSGRQLEPLAAEVGARAREAITTSALGVGLDYDERWLTTVADAGRGNYAFLSRAEALQGFLGRELEQGATSVADAVAVGLELPAGWRVTQTFGGTFEDRVVSLGTLYAGERRRVTLRMQVDAGAVGTQLAAPVRLAYRNARDQTDRNLDLGRLSLVMVNDETRVTASRDATLHAEAVAAFLDSRQAEAVDAWRRGDAALARTIAQDNAMRLRRMRVEAPAAGAAIDARLEATITDLDNFDALSAESAEGRAYGLSSNASRRSRAVAY